MTRSKHSSP